MDQLGSRIKQITSELKEYMEARVDLLVLNIGEQITYWLGESLQKLIGFTILGVGLFFAMIALAIFLGEVLENVALGYLIVSAPLILLGIIFSAAKPRGLARTIQNQFMDGIIKSLEKKGTKEKLQLPKEQQKQLPSKEKADNE